MAATKIKKKSVMKGSASAKKKANGLHLPSLTIKRFRGFRDLSLPKLGRVTLLAGKNGAGKSSVLEAVRLYAAAGDPSVMENILENRKNIISLENEEGHAVDVPDHGGLFFGYSEPKLGDIIEIGFPGAENTLEIELSLFELEELENAPPPLLHMLVGKELRCLTVLSGPNKRIVSKSPFFHSKGEKVAKRTPIRGKMSWRSSGAYYDGMPTDWRIENGDIQRIPCENLGPMLPSDAKIASQYETVELTSKEKRILDILHFIKPQIERLAPQGGHGRKYDGPRMMVKLKGVDSPVPLESVGDGIAHLLGLSVILINAKDGLLLIDEVENGIHYSLFEQLWEFVMRVAHENNVQVIAATHSWDCFKGFARAAWKMKNVEGQVIRIERKGEETWSVPYSEEEALTAANSDIEVR